MITDFGRVVRIYRMDNNISLSTMASTLQVPPSYLNFWQIVKPVRVDSCLNLLNLI